MKPSKPSLPREIIVFFAVLWAICLPLAVPAQECLHYSEYIHWLGTAEVPYARGITIHDGFAYVTGMSFGVQIVEIEDLAQPYLVGEFDTPGYARAVALAGKYAYVADDDEGLHVADVSAPSSPSIIASIPTPDDAMGVALRGEIVYVAASSAGIMMIDVSDPTSPQIAGDFGLPAAATDVECFGDRAIFVHADGIQIVSLSDPLAPSVIGGIELSGHPTDVAIRGDIAYVAASTSGLHIVSMADPGVPILQGSESPAFDFSAVGVWVSGDYAYLGTTHVNPDPDLPVLGRLDVIDVSNPTGPQRVARLNYSLPVYGVAGGHGFVVYANHQDGIHLISDSSPLAAPEIGWSLGNYNSIAVVSPLVGPYALVTRNAVSGAHLIIYDISAPAVPTSVATMSTGTPYGGKDVTIAGNLAYMAAGYAGLLVIDVANPTSPIILGSLDLDADAIEVAVSGNHGYVALFHNEIVVVDVSVPTAPSAVASISIPANARSLDIAGSHLYVGSAEYGLHIYDISNPTAPASVGTVATPSYAGGVMVVEGIAYVSDSDTGLLVVDVADPTTPFIIGQLAVPGHASDVMVAQDVAYVSARDTGLQIVDVSDPEFPTYVGGVLDIAGSSVVANNLVYVASYSGLHIVNLQCPIVTAVALDMVEPDHGYLQIQAQPNPFNPSTTINYTIRDAMPVSLDIYDLRGRLIRRLVNDRWREPGTHDVVWDGRSGNGRAVASGVYLCQMRAGIHRASQRLALVR